MNKYINGILEHDKINIATGNIDNLRTKNSPFVDVTHPDYGAKGDGATDDTTAIQTAINASNGNPVFLPAGAYNISSALTLPANTTVMGSGLTTIAHTSAGTIFDGSATDASNIRVADLTLNSAVASTTPIIDATDWEHGIIERCYVKGSSQAGIGIEVAGNAVNIDLIKNRVESTDIGYRFQASGGSNPDSASAYSCYTYKCNKGFQLNAGTLLTLIKSRCDSYYTTGIEINNVSQVMVLSPLCKSSETPDYDIYIDSTNSATIWVLNPQIAGNATNSPVYANAHVWTDAGILSAYSLNSNFFITGNYPQSFENICPYPNFPFSPADRLIGWSTGGATVSRVDSDEYAPTIYSAEVVNDTGGAITLSANNDHNNQFMRYVANDTGSVSFTAQLVCKTSLANHVRFRIGIEGASGTQYSDYSSYHTGGGSYEVLTLEKTFTYTEDYFDVDVKFLIDISNNVAPVYLNYAQLLIGRLHMSLIEPVDLAAKRAVTSTLKVDKDGHLCVKELTSAPALADLEPGEVGVGDGTGASGEDELFFKPDADKIVRITADTSQSFISTITS